MFDIVSLFSGLVSLVNKFFDKKEKDELVQTGKLLRKGEEDGATLNTVQKAKSAELNADHAALDDELCIDK